MEGTVTVYSKGSADVTALNIDALILLVQTALSNMANVPIERVMVWLKVTARRRRLQQVSLAGVTLGYKITTTPGEATNSLTEEYTSLLSIDQAFESALRQVSSSARFDAEFSDVVECLEVTSGDKVSRECENSDLPVGEVAVDFELVVKGSGEQKGLTEAQKLAIRESVAAASGVPVEAIGPVSVVPSETVVGGYMVTVPVSSNSVEALNTLSNTAAFNGKVETELKDAPSFNDGTTTLEVQETGFLQNVKQPEDVDDDDESSTGSTAGIVIACLVGVAVLVVGAVVYKKRQQNADGHTEVEIYAPYPASGAADGEADALKNKPAESSLNSV